VALASLELFRKDEILARIQPKIAYLKQHLNDEFLPLAHVSDVRQWGFMVGIELVQAKESSRGYPVSQRVGHKVIREARRRGVIIRPLGDIIILMPPLSISVEELKTLLDVTRDSIRAVTED
jgi:adenosylmethionine-8-amino-7-oxononanoate aminotransferase